MSNQNVGMFLLVLIFIPAVLSADAPVFTPYIMIDQFGYRPGDKKVAVIADPQTGYNAADEFVPGQDYAVKDAVTGETVFEGSPVIWNGGQTHTQSGDRGWWFDFSDLDAEGAYYIYDAENQVCSYNFNISPYVYSDVLKTAFKMYYYNRCSMEKVEPWADARWTDDVSFAGPNQDTEARFVDDKNNDDLIRDMSGGWFDAGDYNKYVTFTEVVIHQLLDAYEQNPAAWTDDFNIPKSGNGLPDVIDEIIYELDWMKKMQDMEDGGVHIKIGSITYNSGSPPSTDSNARYYGPKCSSSALTAASVFAHAAVVLSGFSRLDDYTEDLIIRAILAWEWFEDNDLMENCDSQEIKAGDADVNINDQKMMAVTAAVYLFAATDDDYYNDYVTEHYQDVEAVWWWGPYRLASGDALLYYACFLNGDPFVQDDILASKITQAVTNRTFYRFYDDNDLYRAHMPDAQYHWGSNNVKSDIGNLNYDLVFYELDPLNNDQYLERALCSLHYMHGVNPLSKVYLSNVYEIGADNCVNIMYHSWFAPGTKWDNVLTSECGPAPGYVVGGPNKSYSGSESGISNQPPQKAYKDGNAYDRSWEITEPSIYCQSTYLKLLSKFVNGHPVSNVKLNTQKKSHDFKLIRNYPNPFNPSTTIEYTVPEAGHVKMEVFNIQGQRIKILIDEKKSAGHHAFHWDAADFGSDVYFFKIQVESFNDVYSDVKKFVVIK